MKHGRARTAPHPMSTLALVLLGCSPATLPSQQRPHHTHDSATPDTGADDTGLDDTGLDDTGSACPDPVLIAPVDIDLWVGSRYDLVLTGADAVSIDDTPLSCDAIQSHLVCAWTPEETGEHAVTAQVGDCPLLSMPALPVVQPSGALPTGDRFFMALYEAQYTDEVATLADLAAAGVTGVHTYATGDLLTQWQDEAAAAGLACSFHVDQPRDIHTGLAVDALGWWDLPEELRYWYTKELMQLEGLAAAIHAADERPVFMYIPSHYTAEDIGYYVDSIDIIGAGAYADYAAQPHAWIRWRVQSEIEAIEAAGYTVNERLPLGVIGVFNSADYGGATADATEVTHDHLAAVAAGARGLYTFAWWHAVHDADMGDSADAILEIATRISGEEALGEWVVRGQDQGLLDVLVTSGPDQVELTPYSFETALVYPSVWARAWSHAGAWTVVVINSSEEPVEATVFGLPGSRAERVFDGLVEDAPDGALSVSLGRLEARVYRVVRL